MHSNFSSVVNRRLTKTNEIASDYRIQELLMALNDGILDPGFVRLKLEQCVGDRVDLIHYSDGEYGILTVS